MADWFAHPAAQAACREARVLQPMIDLACAIQQVAAPTFAEARRAALVAEHMAALGLQDVVTDELHNVYGRRPGVGGGRTLLLAAHTDTVFPASTDLTLRIERGRIHGPGIGDNSMGVAGMLRLAAALQQCNVPHRGDIWFVATVGEEGLGDLRGMRAAVDRLAGSLGAAIALEGVGYGRIIHAGLGVRRYRISATAPGGHAWSDFGAPSAIHTLTRLAARITHLPSATAPSSYNIGVIEGGTSVNSIAEHASMLLDLRSTSTATLNAMADQVERLAAAVAAEPKQARLSLEVVGNRPAGQTAPDHPLVQAAIRAIRQTGHEPDLTVGSTDANVPLSRGIPTVCIGLTSGGNMHRVDEYVNLEHLPDGMEALTWLTLAATDQ